jgi:hypothetical protein
MTFAEKNLHGVTNNTTAVDALPSPASAHTSVLRNIIVQNRDTVAATVILQLVDSAGATTTRLHKQTLDPDATLLFEGIVVLDATTKKVQIVLAGAITTTQLDYTVAYGDVS